jgi:hypothetical protein
MTALAIFFGLIFIAGAIEQAGNKIAETIKQIAWRIKQ